MTTVFIRKSKLLLLFLLLQSADRIAAQVPFTPGNIVIYRVGPSSATYKPVFLDEYTTAGVLIQSIPMPTSQTGANYSLTMRGSEMGTGALALSPDGKYLAAMGYNLPVVATSCSGCSYTVAVVSYDGNVNTTTRMPYRSAPPGPAVTSNGTDIWGGGCTINSTGVIEHTTIGVAPIDVLIGPPQGSHGINIFSGQLYFSFNGQSTVDNGFIASLGNGLPTTANQIATRLPGLPDNIRPNQFVMADLSPAIPGPDVLYFANGGLQTSSISGNGGIHKYSLKVDGTWAFNGFVGAIDDNSKGLTAKISGNKVTLFCTRKASFTTGQGGELVTITDSSGYNGSFTGNPVFLTSPPAGAGFRGIALAPVAPVCSSLTGLVVNNITGSGADIKWNMDIGSVAYEYAVTTSSTAPSNGTIISSTSLIVNGLSPATTYYIHVRNKCLVLNSPWLTTSFTTKCPSPVPFIISNLLPGKAVIGWNKNSGIFKYEYATFIHAAHPLIGTISNDTSVYLNNLIPGVKYFFHLRGYCTDSKKSDWVSIEIHPGGIEAFPNPVRDKVTIKVSGHLMNGIISISNTEGRVYRRLRLTGNSIEVDMSGFAAGVYWVKYEDYEGYVTKLIKF